MRLGSLLLALAILLPTGLVSADEPAKAAKILLIGKDRDHAPETHEYMDECRLLAKCLGQTPGVEAVVSDGWPGDPKTLEGVTALVFYTAKAGDVLFAPETRPAAEALLKRGVGLVAIHWSTGSDHHVDLWRDTLGGRFGRPPSEIGVFPSRVRQVETSHPICRGWSDFEFRDEYYWGLQFHPQAKPLLVAKVKDKDETIAWTFVREDQNDGRSFGFVCGHFHDCFANDAFRKAVVNGILWSSHLEVPADGAPCAITADDLSLSPDPRRKP